MAKRVQKDVQDQMQQLGELFETMKDKHLGEVIILARAILLNFNMQIQPTKSHAATCP